MEDLYLNQGKPCQDWSVTVDTNPEGLFEDKKVILHLCADLGSDSIFYQRDPAYHVIKIGIDIGVENYVIPKGMVVYGIFSNPVCTEFSTADYSRVCDTDKGMFLVNHCKRIIEDAKSRGGLKFHVLENPLRGTLKKFIGKADFSYQPYEYGSPWTKATALWGEFNIPEKTTTWETVTKNPNLYVRPSRKKPSLALFHKSALQYIPDWQWAKDYIKCDADIRSMCTTGFARSFYEANK